MLPGHRAHARLFSAAWPQSVYEHERTELLYCGSNILRYLTLTCTGIQHNIIQNRLATGKKYCPPYTICLWAGFSCITQVEVYFRKAHRWLSCRTTVLSLTQSIRDLNQTGIQWNKCAREFTRLVSVGDTFLDLMSWRFIFQVLKHGWEQASWPCQS